MPPLRPLGLIGWRNLIFEILILTLFPKDREIFARIKGFPRLGVIPDFRGPFERSEGFWNSTEVFESFRYYYLEVFLSQFFSELFQESSLKWKVPEGCFGSAEGFWDFSRSCE